MKDGGGRGASGEDEVRERFEGVGLGVHISFQFRAMGLGEGRVATIVGGKLGSDLEEVGLGTFKLQTNLTEVFGEKGGGKAKVGIGLVEFADSGDPRVRLRDSDAADE